MPSYIAVTFLLELFCAHDVAGPVVRRVCIYSIYIQVVWFRYAMKVPADRGHGNLRKRPLSTKKKKCLKTLRLRDATYANQRLSVISASTLAPEDWYHQLALRTQLGGFGAATEEQGHCPCLSGVVQDNSGDEPQARCFKALQKDHPTGNARCYFASVGVETSPHIYLHADLTKAYSCTRLENRKSLRLTTSLLTSFEELTKVHGCPPR